MGQGYLIDSNVIIDFAATKIPDKGYAFVENIFNTNFQTSVIVRIEVLGFEDEPEKMAILEAFIDTATEIPLDREISEKTIALRKQYKKLKLGDAIIAATAIVHHLTLITHNINDFKRIEELVLLNPYAI